MVGAVGGSWVNDRYWNAETKIADTLGIDAENYLTRPIEVLEIGNRTYNCLKRAGIGSVGEVFHQTPNDLMGITNFGRLTLEDLLIACEKYVSGAVDNKTEMIMGQPGSKPKSNLSRLISTVSRVVLNMENAVDEDKQREVLEGVLEALSDETLWSQSLVSYDQATVMLIQIKSEKTVSWEEFIPDSLRERPLKVFTKAFAVATGMPFPDSLYSENETVADIVDKIQSSDTDKWRQLCSWICKPLVEVENEVFRKHLDDRERFVIDKRACGNSLEEIGQRIEVSRERVRQIEARAMRKILYRVNISGYIGYLYAYLGCPFMISLQDAYKVTDNDVARVVWYSLRQSKLGREESNSRYYYSEQFEAVVIPSEMNCSESDLESFVSGLPEMVKDSEMDRAILESGLDYRALVAEVALQYTHYPNLYSRHVLTAAEMAEFVIRDHFQDGIQVFSDNDFKLFCDFVKKDYNCTWEYDQRALQKYAALCCYTIDKGIYKHVSNLNTSSQFKAQIREYVIEQFESNGRTAIAYREIFSKMSEKMMAEDIENHHVLHSVLSSMHLKYPMTKDYILREEGDSFENDLTKYVEERYPVPFSKIMRDFGISSEEVCYNILSRCPKLVKKGNMVLYKV